MSTPWRHHFGEMLRLRGDCTVSEWAQNDRVIPPGTSPEHGKWDKDRVPYLNEPMDCMSDPRVTHVVMPWGSQLGKTEGLLNAIGYFCDQDPSAILGVQPTIAAAETFSKERVAPMFKHTPALQGKLAATTTGRGSSRKSANTIDVKHFAGGFLALVGANAPTGLAMRAIRVLMLDEVDRFPKSAGTEGDPIRLAIQRTATYGQRKKILMTSSPTIKDHSAIMRWYERTDQRVYEVPCPQCGAHQVLRWEHVKWDDDDPDTAHYECAENGCVITERDKLSMLERGRWVATKPFKGMAGFHLSSLYSPWVTFVDLVAEWLDARGDQEALKVFINTKLGETWEDKRDKIDTTDLAQRVETYSAEVPDGVIVLTAGVDTQDDRLEYEVVGWGVGGESWGIKYGVIAGDPDQPEVWAELDVVLASGWTKADDSTLTIRCVAVDAMGHKTDGVYRFTKPRAKRGIHAIQGKGGPGKPLVGKPGQNNRYRALLFPVGVDGAKTTVVGRVDQTMAVEPNETHGPGFCHFPKDPARGYDSVWFRGLLSEQLRMKGPPGRQTQYWHKVYKRNEPLDCRVYAWAAVAIMSPTLAILSESRNTVATTASRGPTKRRVRKMRRPG